MSKRLWLLLAVILAAWWFFMGDNPVQIARSFVGRGRRLSLTTMSNGRDCDQTPAEVQAQVVTAMGREVSLDAVCLARVSASEHPGANEKEKSAIQWVCKNDADAHGWSLEYTTTVNGPGWGHQTDRRYASHGGGVAGLYEIHEDDLFIAESILPPQSSIPDLTGGATKFVHMTGYATFKDFLTGHPKVAEWGAGGLAPIFLGGVSTLVILLPKSKVTADMDTTGPTGENG